LAAIDTVADIMHRDAVTVGLDADVERLVRLLRKHELPGVPVVDSDKRVVGIVTESDLILRDEDADLRLPAHIDLLGGVIYLGRLKDYDERLKKAFALTAADVMTPDPVTVKPTDTIRTAAKIIAERRHNRLPVVEDDGRLAGVVTRLDVLDALTR
jgi:CBS domain-containing protein